MTVNPLAALRAVVVQYPTQLEAAKALHISPSYLSDVLKRRRGVSDALLRRLGLRRETSYALDLRVARRQAKRRAV